MSENNVIYGINGPVVTIKGETGLSMMEMVYVGEKRLVGGGAGLCYRRRNVRHPRPRNNQKYI